MLNQALIWKPNTGSWTWGAQWDHPDIARLYHSVALLLRDATVLVAGGGANRNAHIYLPPYLYTSSGGLAARPIIATCPSRLVLGQSFTVGVTSAAPVQRVTLIKTGSVTHSCNFEQRFMELSFTVASGGLSVSAPATAALAPPGNYLLSHE